MSFHCPPVTLAGLTNRLHPLLQKAAGRLPLCPWFAVLSVFDPRTLGARPPKLKIEKIETDGDLQKLRFDGKHDFWFPSATKITEELWGEYLSVFWKDRTNSHFYLIEDFSIRPGDVCMDCGSCEGFFVLQALEVGAAKIVCIEPNPAMVRCLEKTFASEIKDGRVIIRLAGLSSFSGHTSFSFDTDYPSFGQMGGATPGENVQVETLEAIMSQTGLTRLDFIKMDIEGAEIQALEGAMPVLKKYHPRLALTTYHRTFAYPVLHALATAAGYRKIRPRGLTQWSDGIYRPIMLHAVA